MAQHASPNVIGHSADLRPQLTNPRTGFAPITGAATLDDLRAAVEQIPEVDEGVAAGSAQVHRVAVFGGEGSRRGANGFCKSDNLLDGLALHVQRDQQCSDLGVGTLAAQNLSHDLTRLPTGERGAVVGDLVESFEDHEGATSSSN